MEEVHHIGRPAQMIQAAAAESRKGAARTPGPGPDSTFPLWRYSNEVVSLKILAEYNMAESGCQVGL